MSTRIKILLECGVQRCFGSKPGETDDAGMDQKSRLVTSSATTLLALLVLMPMVSANDWPSFRGPQGSGVGAGAAPIRWDVESGEGIVWNVAIEGLALASPIVWQERVFLSTAVGTEANPQFEEDPTFGYGIIKEQDVWQWKVLCLNKATGERLWESVAHSGVPRQGRHSESTHANATPATDGSFVVAMFGSEGLYCYSVEGELKWTADLGILRAGPEGHSDLEWGYGGSPIIYDDKVIVQCDLQNGSYLLVLDLSSGKELLRIDRGDIPSWATPNAHTVNGRSQVVCNGYKQVAAYDLSSGEKVWELHGKGDVPVPRPIFAKGLIFCTAGHGGRGLYAIQTGARGDLTPSTDGVVLAGLAWWREREGSYIPTPLVYDGILYVGDERGVLRAYDASAGERFYEKRIVERQGGRYYASPVTAGGRIYLTENKGVVHVVQAGKRFERLASNDMGETTMATPAISEGRLFVRTRSQLFCIGE